MAINILTPMPPDREDREPEVDLVELRVLEGPNRFFTRPAIKLEFEGRDPGRAAEAAANAALAVRRLKNALGLPEPGIAVRHSVDRRRTISQAVAASAARIALGRSAEARELAGLRAIALGPTAHLPRARIPIVAVTGTNG
jgi:hypothetical protein